MSYLLFVDAAINLALGLVLLFFPRRLLELLGMPMTEQVFYPSILGAVLFGIGIALLIQIRNAGGLGLMGAIAINLCSGTALAFWLIFGALSLPTRGLVFLWLLVAVLVGISGLELFRYTSTKESA